MARPNGADQHHCDGPLKTRSSTSATKRWCRKQCRTLMSCKFWKKRLPIVTHLHSYNASFLISDIVAGITVGLTFIPSSMASAGLAGLPPQFGLYSCILCYFVYAILGSCRAVVIGPTVLSAMLCAPFVEKFGQQIIFTIAFYAGCLVTALGVFNLGFLVDFISAPVMDGFLSAAAINAISNQVPKLIGIQGGGSSFIGYWVNTIKNVQHGVSLWDTVLGVSCIVTILFLQNIRKYAAIPPGKIQVSTRERVLRCTIKYLSLGRTAVVVLISTCIIAAITTDGVAPVKVAGDIGQGLPEFGPPNFVIIYDNVTLSFQDTVKELSTAVAIPLVIILESSVAAKAFAGTKSIDATQEMISVGIANIIGSFAQSIPAAASATRTTINHIAGVKTPLSGIVAGLVVLAALGLFRSYLKYLPDATLAALIMCAVSLLIHIHKDTKKLWRSKKSDLIPLYATFMGCLCLGLDFGMIFGITVNTLHLLYAAARPKLAVHTCKIFDREVMLVTPDRSLTYPAAEYVKRVVRKQAQSGSSHMLIAIDGSHVSHIDSTSIKVLKSLLREIQQEIVLWRFRDDLIHSLIRYDKQDPGCFRHEDTLEQVVTELDRDHKAQAQKRTSLNNGDSEEVSSMLDSVSTPPLHT